MTPIFDWLSDAIDKGRLSNPDALAKTGLKTSEFLRLRNGDESMMTRARVEQIADKLGVQRPWSILNRMDE